MAYCDAKTLDPETDLLAVDEVFSKVANEVYQVLHNPKHKWYYIPDQLDSEVAIFAGYDSRQGQRLSYRTAPLIWGIQVPQAHGRALRCERLFSTRSKRYGGI
jgi:hypothetical protein